MAIDSREIAGDRPRASEDGSDWRRRAFSAQSYVPRAPGDAVDDGWVMEAPEMVTGWEGDSVILLCSFSLPDPGYKGNISVVWTTKRKSSRAVVFNCTNYLPLNAPSNTSENLIHRNAGRRYWLAGNPREMNASLAVEKLTLPDSQHRYQCWVALTGNGSEVLVSSTETTLLVMGKLLSVTGTKGGDATLPCSFTMPGIHPSNIYVIWRRGSPQSRPFINDTLGLASHTNPGESETANEGNRYKVVGNVGDGDTSLRIRGLELNDTSRYFCHVHVTFTLQEYTTQEHTTQGHVSHGHTTQEHVTQNQLWLRVVAPAVILSLSLVAGDGAGSGIVCTAEGEPPANITWIDPENNTLPINTSHTPVTHVPDKYQTVGEIRGPRLRGTYRCVAENTQGRDTRDILVAAPQRDGSFIIAILCLIPLVKFLTMLVTGIILVCKMGGLSLMLYKFHTFFCNMNTFTQCLSCRENVPRHWTVQGLHLS
eukprot:gi/632980549/ref/XP_007907096.1/ PREDICTED: sialic acid-binding Ig-like lectin 15 isoform X1 [Callorhinchus milii]